jgi:hypothetical protein
MQEEQLEPKEVVRLPLSVLQHHLTRNVGTLEFKKVEERTPESEDSFSVLSIPLDSVKTVVNAPTRPPALFFVTPPVPTGSCATDVSFTSNTRIG